MTRFLAYRRPSLDASGVLPKTDWLPMVIVGLFVFAAIVAAVFNHCGVLVP